MPVSRDQIIGAKYILYLLLSAIGIIVVLASLGIMSLLGMTITLYSLLFNAAIGISAALFAGGISLPCVYFFDAEKSQIVYMIAFVASTGIITALVLLINLLFHIGCLFGSKIVNREDVVVDQLEVCLLDRYLNTGRIDISDIFLILVDNRL